MARQEPDFDPAKAGTGGCFVQLHEGGPRCDGPWSFVVENMTRPGFMQVCHRHMFTYRIFAGRTEGVTWRAWTRAQWELEGRGAAVQRRVDAANN